MNWNLGVRVQQSFLKDWVVDVRYLGTRGVHLLSQTVLNKVALVTPSQFLPVYLTAPSQAELNALTVTSAQFSDTSKINPWLGYGFSNSLGVTSYVPQGNSIYHGLAIDVSRRFCWTVPGEGWLPWSHLRDDSTAEVNTTTLLPPRRPQDFRNMRGEWGGFRSRPPAAAHGGVDVGTLRGSADEFQLVPCAPSASGYSFSGTYTAESPQWVTPQGGIDANVNADTASDRTVVNVNGVKGTGSDVRALTNSAGQTVAYVANNPNAQYLTARAGMLANAGRNTLPTRGINNFDMSVARAFVVRERYRAEIRADFYNALNHAQWVPGRVNTIATTARNGETNYLTPQNALFGRWDPQQRSYDPVSCEV